MPSMTATPKKSSRKPSARVCPMIGTAKSSWNSAPTASTIVKIRTMKPQKTKKCARPGTLHLSSRFWPNTSVICESRRWGASSSRPGLG